MRGSIYTQEAKQTREYIIYVRIDPRDEIARYVGLTDNLKRRTQQILHLPNENVHLDVWIQDLQTVGLLPTTEELEIVRSWDKAMERENYWIQHYLQQGAPLLNIRVRGRPRVTRPKVAIVESQPIWTEQQQEAIDSMMRHRRNRFSY